MIESMRDLAGLTLLAVVPLAVLLWFVRKREKTAAVVYGLIAVILSCFLFCLMDYMIAEVSRNMPDHMKLSGLEKGWELTQHKLQTGFGILNLLIAFVCPAGFFILLAKKDQRLWCIPFAVVYLLHLFWCFVYVWL